MSAKHHRVYERALASAMLSPPVIIPSPPSLFGVSLPHLPRCLLAQSANLVFPRRSVVSTLGRLRKYLIATVPALIYIADMAVSLKTFHTTIYPSTHSSWCPHTVPARTRLHSRSTSSRLNNVVTFPLLTGVRPSSALARAR